MVICVDLDEVCNDFVTVTVALYNEDSGDSITVDDVKDYQIAKAFKPEYRDKLFNYFNDPHFIEMLKWNVGWVVQIMRECKDDIYFLTATHPKNIYKKFACLLKALIDAGYAIKDEELYRRLITTTNKQLIKTDILIDDCFDNLQFDGNVYNILVDKPWNRALARKFNNTYLDRRRIIICDNVNDIPEIIENIRKYRERGIGDGQLSYNNSKS